MRQITIAGSSLCVPLVETTCDYCLWVDDEQRGSNRTERLFGRHSGSSISMKCPENLTMNGPSTLVKANFRRCGTSPQKSPQNSFPRVIFNDLRCRPCVPSHCKCVIVQPVHHSVRRISVGSVRNARSTAGSMATSAVSRMAHVGKAIMSASVALTW
jgi:hypothetical protein